MDGSACGGGCGGGVVTHVRIVLADGTGDTGSVPLPFVPLVGDVIHWDWPFGPTGWFRVVSRLLYCWASTPSATLVVERCPVPRVPK